MFPPGEMGTASFDRPAGTLNVLESAALADVESVTVEGRSGQNNGPYEVVELDNDLIRYGTNNTVGEKGANVQVGSWTAAGQGREPARS